MNTVDLSNNNTKRNVKGSPWWLTLELEAIRSLLELGAKEGLIQVIRDAAVALVLLHHEGSKWPGQLLVVGVIESPRLADKLADDVDWARAQSDGNLLAEGFKAVCAADTHEALAPRPVLEVGRGRGESVCMIRGKNELSLSLSRSLSPLSLSLSLPSPTLTRSMALFSQ